MSANSHLHIEDFFPSKWTICSHVCKYTESIRLRQGIDTLIHSRALG